MEPDDPESPEISQDPEGETPPGPSRRKQKIVLYLVIALAAVVAATLLLRRGSSVSSAPAARTPQASPPAKAVSLVLVKLTPEAAMVADRFNCLCGDCQDTLGKCTCTHHSGSSSNDMKAVLNQIVAEKKTLAAIEAAMVEKYGPRVLAVPPPAPSPEK